MFVINRILDLSRQDILIETLISLTSEAKKMNQNKSNN